MLRGGGTTSKPIASYHYSPSGDLIEVSIGGTSARQFAYTNHLLTKQTFLSGQIGQYVYDQTDDPKSARVIHHWLDTGEDYRFYYNDSSHLSRLTTITDALGYGTHYRYSHHPYLERITHIQKADNSHIRLDYDKAGRLTTHTDELGHRTHYEYTPDNLPSKRIDTLGHTLHYHYDVHRRLAKLTNQNGEDWMFVYDKLDNLIFETRFDGTQSSYRYDSLGHLIHQADNLYLPKHEQRHLYLQRNLIGELTHKHALCYEEQSTTQSNIHTDTDTDNHPHTPHPNPQIPTTTTQACSSVP